MDASKHIEKLYIAHKNGAESRGLMFTLPMVLFATYYGKPCYYCGCKTWTIGLDRVDNSKGYIEGNIVSCCGACNRMKSAMSFEGFLQRVVDIYRTLELGDILTYQSSISEAAVKSRKPINK